MVQHVDIPDASRHEPRGASTATTGQALFSIGGGETVFRKVDYADVEGIPVFSTVWTLELTSSSVVDQTITVANTAAQVAFGAASASSNVSIDALGTVTFLTDGTYFLFIELLAAKTGGMAATRLFTRELLNATEMDRASCIRFKGDDTTSQRSLFFQTVIEAVAGDTYKLEYAIDTNNTVGFISDTIPGALLWTGTDTHSTHLRVYSFGA